MYMNQAAAAEWRLVSMFNNLETWSSSKYIRAQIHCFKFLVYFIVINLNIYLFAITATLQCLKSTTLNPTGVSYIDGLLLFSSKAMALLERVCYKNEIKQRDIGCLVLTIMLVIFWKSFSEKLWKQFLLGQTNTKEYQVELPGNNSS